MWWTPMWPSAHVAARLDAISPSADHLGGGQDAPPVRLGAGGMAHHGEQGLLEDVGRGAAGWEEKGEEGEEEEKEEEEEKTI